jgi:hypothetical protein
MKWIYSVRALAVAPKQKGGSASAYTLRLLLAAMFVLFATFVLPKPLPCKVRIWYRRHLELHRQSHPGRQAHLVGPTSESMGGATAYNGTFYWAGWDLDNVKVPSASKPLPCKPDYLQRKLLLLYQKPCHHQ